MLYVSATDPRAMYTAQQTMGLSCAADGSPFVPLRLPEYDREELTELLALPFLDCVCRVINRFFPVWLRAERLKELGFTDPEAFSVRHKVILVQMYDRKTGHYRGIKAKLLEWMGCRVTGDSTWPGVAVDIGWLFGLYGHLRRKGLLCHGERMNLALSATGFCLPVAVALSREMGLPMGSCLCVCGGNTMPRELLHRGEVRLETLHRDSKTTIRDDNSAWNMERLMLYRLGRDVAVRYEQTVNHGGVFTLTAEEHLYLRQGFGVSVVGAARAMSMIPRVYRNASCLLSPHSAMIYSGLMDYRSADGENGTAVLLAEESPMKWGEAVLKAMNIPVESVTGQIEALELKAAKGRKGS